MHIAGAPGPLRFALQPTKPWYCRPVTTSVTKSQGRRERKICFFCPPDDRTREPVELLNLSWAPKVQLSGVSYALNATPSPACSSYAKRRAICPGSPRGIFAAFSLPCRTGLVPSFSHSTHMHEFSSRPNIQSQIRPDLPLGFAHPIMDRRQLPIVRTRPLGPLSCYKHVARV